MADDDDKPKKHTFDSLFLVYCNYTVIALEQDNIIYNAILLSQIDYWLEQAKLLRTTFTTTQTGLLYMQFKKWRLDFDDFLKFIQQLCFIKDLDEEDIKLQMLEAGVPAGAEMVVVK